MSINSAGLRPKNCITSVLEGRLSVFEWIVFGLILLALSPYLLNRYAPIADLPNHAARLFLECHRQDPQVSALYVVRPALIPNLALDLINLPLCGAIAPADVVKGVMVLSLALITLAGWIIQRKVYGRASVGLLALPATAMSLVTLMGYANYLCAIAVLMVMIAVLIDRLEDIRWTMGVGLIGGVLLFFCHILALGLAIAVFFGLWLKGSASPRRWIPAGLRTLAMFAVPLLLFVVAERERKPLSIDFGDKLFALIVPLLSGAPTELEVGLIAAMVVILVVTLVLRRGETDRRLLLALTAGVAYAFLLPFRINDAIDVGQRTMAAALPMLALAIPPTQDRRTGAFFAVACAGLVAFHLTVAARVWPGFCRQIEELRAALPVIPRGAKVLSVWQTNGPTLGAIAAPVAYTHLTAYAVIDREAYYPIEFMGRGMQPMSPAPAVAAITPPPATRLLSVEDAIRLANWSGPPTPSMAKAGETYAISWPRTFDRLLYIHFGSAPNFDPQRLQTVTSGSFFSILEPRQATRIDKAP